MKPFLPAVIALVAGILLGAWQPRGELLATRAELDRLRDDRTGCRDGAARSIRSLLHAEADDLRPARTVRNVSGAEAAAGADPGPADGTDPLPDAEGPDPTGSDPGPSPDAIADGLEAALDARRAQARQALVEQAGLDEEELDEVDAAMAEMNRALRTEVDRFVEASLADGDVDRRALMDFAAEALDITIAADDRMRELLPAETYAEVDDSAVDPFSWLTGDTLSALARLEDL